MLQVPEETSEAEKPEQPQDQAPEGAGAALVEDGAEERAEGAEEPAPPGHGPGQELDDEELRRRIGALLFASAEPLSLNRLVQLLDRPDRRRVGELLATLRDELVDLPVPVILEEIQGGYRLFTDPKLAEVVARLRSAPRSERITSAALETLAIVAYRQPVTKAEVEAIRGVQSAQMLRTLVDRGLARVTGRADQPGSPLQYGTTREFLDRFGLASLKDLPRDAELAGD